MASTTITGTIFGVSNTALANKWIVFRIDSVGTDSSATHTVLPSSESIQTDASGDFSIVVWNNGNSGTASLLGITIEGSSERFVVIPTGTATIELWDLLQNYPAAGADPQLPSTSNLFVRKANDLSDLANAGTARTNLGVAIGSNVQAHSAVLDATTASFLTADETKLDGIATGAQVNDPTTVVDADIGVTVQAYDSGLTDLVGFSKADGSFIVGDGTDWVAETGATARASLGFPANAVTGTTLVTSTTYTVLETDSFVLVDDDAAGGAVTVSIPSAATLGAGWAVSIKKLGSTGFVILDPAGSETIDGLATRSVVQKLETTRLVSDGTNFQVAYPADVTGWGRYNDGGYTSASPLNVNASKVQITIDTAATTPGTGSKIETYLPPGVAEFWNSTSNTIRAPKVGDAFVVRLNFKADPVAALDYGELIFDIGDGSPDVPVSSQTISFDKVSETTKSFTVLLYAEDTFLANGCKIYLDTSSSGDSIAIYDISLVVTRVSSPHR